MMLLPLDSVKEARARTKRCPICCPAEKQSSQPLPVSEFGTCRARKDGRNLYCKSCIRKKVAASRKAIRAYRAARRRISEQLSLLDAADGMKSVPPAVAGGCRRPLAKLAPIDRVKEAIARGARTQTEIAVETRLGKDEIGDALAHLLLWSKEVTTRTVDGTRHYQLSKQQTVNSEQPPASVARKRDLPVGFHSLRGLMPGREERKQQTANSKQQTVQQTVNSKQRKAAG